MKENSAGKVNFLCGLINCFKAPEKILEIILDAFFLQA